MRIVPPATPPFGIDCNDRLTDLTLNPGVDFAGRYLRTDDWIDPRTGYSPLLTVEEAHFAAEIGLDLISFYQEGKSEVVLEGFRAGVDCATKGRDLQAERGGGGQPIIPTVDFWPSQDQHDAILAHWKGWRSKIGLARLGCYGPLPVIKLLVEAGLVRYPIQSIIGGYAAPVHPAAVAVQFRNTDNPETPGYDFGARGYLCYDRARETAKGDYGQWRPRFN